MNFGWYILIVVAFLLPCTLSDSSADVIARPVQQGLPPPRVEAVLRAPWPNYPLAAEVSEFIASNSPELFWRYLETLPAFSSTTSPRQQLNLSLETASSMLSPTQLSLLSMSLDLRYYNPSIQFQHTVALETLQRAKSTVFLPLFVST